MFYNYGQFIYSYEYVNAGYLPPPSPLQYLPPIDQKPVLKKPPKKPPPLKKRKNRNPVKYQNQENINAQMEDCVKDKNLDESDRGSRGKNKKNRNHSPPSKQMEKVSKEPLTVRYYAPLKLFVKLNISPYEIYHKLLPYVLPIEKLRDNGFPFESTTNPGKAEFYQHIRVPNPENSNVRMCSRCGDEYTISDDGKYFSETVCHYHIGKRLPLGDIYNAGAYSCCGNPFMSDGCQIGKCHVCSFGSLDNVDFVKTREKRHGPSYCVYALDCEMCYTVQGLEITRVSVVGTDGLTVYNSYVLPDNPIIDYNTQFSGITASHLQGIKTTLADVQAYLLKLLTANTILVGHGLENDLKALHLIHHLIIDTSVVFSEQSRKARKFSLKTLANTYLKRTIQQGQHGHDSVEDARTCIELMLWKIQKDPPPPQTYTTVPSIPQWQRPLSINHVMVSYNTTVGFWVPPIGSPCDLY